MIEIKYAFNIADILTQMKPIIRSNNVSQLILNYVTPVNICNAHVMLVKYKCEALVELIFTPFIVVNFGQIYLLSFSNVVIMKYRQPIQWKHDSKKITYANNLL